MYGYVVAGNFGTSGLLGFAAWSSWGSHSWLRPALSRLFRVMGAFHPSKTAA
jgi:hypothetical protein